MHGRPNDLLQRLAGDPAFAGIDFSKVLDAKRYVGRAPEQVERFLAEVVKPVLKRYRTTGKKDVSLNV